MAQKRKPSFEYFPECLSFICYFPVYYTTDRVSLSLVIHNNHSRLSLTCLAYFWHHKSHSDSHCYANTVMCLSLVTTFFQIYIFNFIFSLNYKLLHNTYIFIIITQNLLKGEL